MVLATGLNSLLLAAAVAAGPAPSDLDLLHQAEAAIRAGMEARPNPQAARPFFREAAACYETLRQRGARNPDLYRDEGSAYLLAGDLPRAILAYRRGLRLAPTDRDLQADLEYAREQVAYPESNGFGRPRDILRPPWLPRLAPGWGLTLGLLLYSLGWVALTRWTMTHRAVSLRLAVGTFLAAALLAGDLAIEGWLDRQEQKRPLVVLADDGVMLRTGNGLAYPPRYETPLNRGVEARLLFARGGWLQIELGGGEVGWVPRDYTLVDEE